MREKVLREMKRRVPAELGGTIVLDAGDHFSGSNFFNFLQGEAEMCVLEALGYDAAALGNHDFDARLDGECGLSRFKKVAEKYSPSVQHLCGNVLGEDDDQSVLPPYAVFEPFPGTNLKVGVAAVLGKSAWDVTPVNLRKGVKYADYLESARVSAEALR
jgi:5'-nucleotidase